MQKGQVFVTADTHFGHNLLAKLRGFDSVKEHDEYIIDSINSCVQSKGNVLWILGDIAFGKENVRKLEKLVGIKKIVLGNHDKYDVKFYANRVNKVFGVASLHNLILTHIPVHPSNIEFRYKGNIHGHMHSKKIEGDSRYFCASLEQNNLKPFRLEDILSSMK